MADVKYPKDVPVDEPVAKPKAAKPKVKLDLSNRKSMNDMFYPKDVPVDEPTGMAKGGSASSRADGCAQRGKTRGTMVMCSGGMAKGK